MSKGLLELRRLARKGGLIDSAELKYPSILPLVCDRRKKIRFYHKVIDLKRKSLQPILDGGVIVSRLLLDDEEVEDFTSNNKISGGDDIPKNGFTGSTIDSSNYQEDTLLRGLIQTNFDSFMEKEEIITHKDHVVSEFQLFRQLPESQISSRLPNPGSIILMKWPSPDGKELLDYKASVLGYNSSNRKAVIQYEFDWSIEENVDLSIRSWSQESDLSSHNQFKIPNFSVPSSYQGEIKDYSFWPTFLKATPLIPLLQDRSSVYNEGDNVLYCVNGLLRPGVVLEVQNYQHKSASQCSYKLLFIDDSPDILLSTTKWIKNSKIRLGLKETSDALDNKTATGRNRKRKR